MSISEATSFNTSAADVSDSPDPAPAHASLLRNWLSRESHSLSRMAFAEQAYYSQRSKLLYLCRENLEEAYEEMAPQIIH